MPGATQVLYRKWRSQKFAELIGQDHITQTLRRAVAENRISHAYLFTGPRGTGKTSTARILAKALNCSNPNDGEPDDQCDNCVAVVEGRNLDVIEIDAASNRGIDDIRDLRDKIQFTPGTGEYKVYIIDEVHMLTPPAFNALLKTLEEPPPHAILVLATTEVDKVPATIISRCQRYDFRRIPNQGIIDGLSRIASEEGFEIDDDALAIIARVAWGSMRDALNVLEQLAVSYQGKVSAKNAQELLGLGDTGASIKLATALLGGDAAAALGVVNQQASAGADLKALQSATVEALRAALLIKTGVEDALSHPAEVVTAMRDATAQINLEKVLATLAAIGEVELKGDSSTPLPLELAIVRAVATPAVQTQPAPSEPTRRTAPPAPAAPRPSARTTPAPEPQQTPGPTAAPRAAPEPDEPPPRAKTAADPHWDQLLRALNRTTGKRYNLAALLRGASSHEVVESELRVHFTHRSNAERMEEELGDVNGRKAVEDAVAAAFGVQLSVKAVHGAGGDTKNNPGDPSDSPLVRAAMAMGARIIDDGPDNPDNPGNGDNGEAS